MRRLHITVTPTGLETTVFHLDIYRDVPPEQRMAAMRDEIRRAERIDRARAETIRRRLERRAALRARVALVLRRRRG